MDNAELGQEIGKRITAAMTLAGTSVNEAAKRSGIPNTTLNRKLRAPETFTVDELRRLAVAVDVHPAQLIRVAA